MEEEGTYKLTVNKLYVFQKMEIFVKKNSKIKELKELINEDEMNFKNSFEIAFNNIKLKDENDLESYGIVGESIIKQIPQFRCDDLCSSAEDIEFENLVKRPTMRIKKEMEKLSYPHKIINDWNYIVELKIDNSKSEFNNFKFYVHIKYPYKYPFISPLIRIMTPIFHPLFSHGSIYCDIFLERKWTPYFTADHILTVIYCLFEETDGLYNECPNHFVKDILKDFDNDEKLKVCSFYTSLMNNQIDGVNNRMKYLCKKDKKISLQFLLVLERMKKENKIVIPRVIRNYIISMFVLQFLEQIKTQFYHPLFNQSFINKYFPK